MKIEVRYVILMFYLALSGSTIYMFAKNLGPRFDSYAFVFQLILLAVCATGFIGTLLNLNYSTRFNQTFMIIISILYGLALLNAFFFHEFGYITIREIILYILVIIIDYLMLKKAISKH